MTREYKSFINRPFLFLCFMNFLINIVFNMTSPIIPRYAISLGASATISGVLAGIFSITALIVRPFSGALADNVNKKLMIAGGVTLMALGSFGMTMTSSIPVMMLMRIVQGTGFCLNGTVIISAAIAFMPQDRIGEGISYFSLASVISQSIGPAISLELGGRYGYRPMLLVIGSLAAVCAVLISVVPYEGREREPLRLRPFKLELNSLFAKKLLPYTLFVGLFSFCNSQISNFLSLRCDEAGITGYSIYFTINAVALFAVKAIGGKLIDSKGLSFVLLPAYLSTAAAMFFIGKANSLGFVLAASVFMAIGIGFGQPGIQAECVKQMGQSQRGLATSMYYLGCDFFQGIGPVVGGSITDATGSYSNNYFAACALMIFGFVSYSIFAAAKNRAARGSSTESAI